MGFLIISSICVGVYGFMAGIRLMDGSTGLAIMWGIGTLIWIGNTVIAARALKTRSLPERERSGA